MTDLATIAGHLDALLGTATIPDAMTDKPASGEGESLRMGTFSVVGLVKIDIGTYGGCRRADDSAYSGTSELQGRPCPATTATAASVPALRFHLARR